MGWLEKLKALLNIEFNAPIVSVNINSRSNNTTPEKDCDSPYVIDDQSKKLEVYLDKLPQEKKKQFQEVIQEYIDEGNRLLEVGTSSLLKKLYNYSPDKNDRQILSFFQPLIPQKDFEALEDSLFLRFEFQKGENVSNYKQDIRSKLGQRGNNIANLCTAGYFEEFLIPLYNSSKERFKELYEIIVEKSIVAIFVHSSTRSDDIPTKISNKIAISKKYGINFLHIHGIGDYNVKKIKKCIKEKKPYFDFFEKEIYEKDNIIIVELLFK